MNASCQPVSEHMDFHLITFRVQVITDCIMHAIVCPRAIAVLVARHPICKCLSRMSNIQDAPVIDVVFILTGNEGVENICGVRKLSNVDLDAA